MKGILRNTVYYSIGLFIIDLSFAGVTISNGLFTIVLGAIILTLLTTFIKPILSLITFPINALLLGLFTYVIDAFMLYILTIFVPGITITGFQFEGINYAGFVIPSFHINTFFAYILSALVLFLVKKLLEWLTK